MTTNQMREAIIKAYPGEKWKKKCNKMADKQICAIFLNMKKEGKI